MKLVILFYCMIYCFTLFSQKQNREYTLLDYYKQNWRKDTKTGKYYETIDLCTFFKYNRVNLKVTGGPDSELYKSTKGLTRKQVRKILGEPTMASSYNYKYIMNDSKDYDGVKIVCNVQVLFDIKTEKSICIIQFDEYEKVGGNL